MGQSAQTTQVNAEERREVMELAIQQLKNGRAVLLGRGGGSTSVVMSAQTVSVSTMAWAVRSTSGFLYATVPPSVALSLHVPPMAGTARCDSRYRGYRVAVDAAEGIGTGISAVDRATTARVLADPQSQPTDLIRPGHLMTMQIDDRGVMGYADVPEAASDLCRWALLQGVAICGSLVTDEGALASSGYVEWIAETEGVPLISCSDVEALVSQGASPQMK